MASNQLSFSIYPPDIDCFWSTQDDPLWKDNFKTYNCSVTSNMVNFLNLTGADYKPYLAAYCVQPPADDDCPFGFCPNPDIAGPLVRVASKLALSVTLSRVAGGWSGYITGFCLAILIFYEPTCVKHAFWSQMLITYSLLLTCGISLIYNKLTRFHSIVLIAIVCSPVNVYFTGYSIRAFWSTHRLDEVLGKKQYIQRAMTFFSVAVWIAILVYVYLPQSYTKFAQDSCRGDSIMEALFLGTPFVFAWDLATLGKGGILLLLCFLAIPILIAFAWAVAIIRKSHKIWTPGELYRPRFGEVWRTVVDHYPFLSFLSIVVVPTVYWIAIIELGILSENDDGFSLTFGQVLAVVSTIEPMIQVAHFAPDLWRWSTNLPWVRLIKRTPKVSGLKEMGTDDVESMKEAPGNKDEYF